MREGGREGRKYKKSYNKCNGATRNHVFVNLSLLDTLKQSDAFLLDIAKEHQT